MRALRHDGLQMPLGGKLSARQIAEFSKWIEDGAIWPESRGAVSAESSVVKRARTHWAFQAVADPNPPAVRDKAWVLNEVDAFVLAKLEGEGFRPCATGLMGYRLNRADR